jgi:alpha-ketoglutarate-dependent 2,4-dichlorophenoxyacetate dioxygenase
MRSTTFRLRPLHPHLADFAAEASGVDLARPIDDATVRAIDAAMDRHAVLVFRDQPLDEDAQIAFASRFGTLSAGLKKLYPSAPTRFRHEATIDISNVDDAGRPLSPDDRRTISNFANQLWHSDSSFQLPAAKYSMLSAVVVTKRGGETEYCDLRAAYDALAGDVKAEIAGLHSVHEALHTRIWLGHRPTEAELAGLPPIAWPLVRTHAGSGRKVLWVGAHATRIVERTLADGRMLLHDLLEHATERRFVYRHAWRAGDLVIWDNRAVLHRGRRWDAAERRELRRTSTNDPDSLRDGALADAREASGASAS